MSRHLTNYLATLSFCAFLFLLEGCANYKPHVAPVDDLTSEDAPTGELMHSSFLVGDLGQDYARGLTTLDAMVSSMPTEKKRNSLLLLGDIVGKDGLSRNDEEEKAHLDAIIDRLESIKGKVYYTPGENELGNDSRFSKLERLEEYFEDHSGKKVRFMPNNVCSGPDDEELTDNVGLIGLNSAWYLADWSKEEETNEGCDYKSRDAMVYAAADEIKGYRNQVKIVMMHHPLQSNGNYGGNYSLKQHLLPLPIVGTIVRGLQAGFAGRQMTDNLQMREFINGMKLGIDDERKVIFVAGHEHNMMLVHEEEYMLVTAGSGSVAGPARGGEEANFVQGAVGYGRLDFYDSGEVYLGFYRVDANGREERAFYRRIIEDQYQHPDENVQEVPTEAVSERIVKSPVYATGGQERGDLYRSAFGRKYRDIYFTPVEVELLRIDTFAGGLRPYRRGGGQTTMSLHTEGADGRLYQLRSIRKNPGQLLPGILEQSVAADIAKDQFTAIHPYAPLALPSLQRPLDLYGADPLLFYVPKQDALGDYNTNFGGEMYWVEQRPDEDWSGTRFFGGSKNIVSNGDAREEITEDWKNYADQRNFARARLFDFFIGDWDRHADQWRWATFEEEDGRVRYVPIARDRDQVFSDFDGFSLALARTFVPEARKLRPFTGDIEAVKWRALNGKWNDRFFLNAITREEMLTEARRIQETITDEMIDEALARLPEAVKQISLDREQIAEKLKSRLRQLDRAAEEYYSELAKSVNVLATNKDDVIRATGLADGSLRVQLYDADKDHEADEMYYDRTFLPAETDQVVVYGLDGDDIFQLEGERARVKLRLIGGTDGDEVDAAGDLRAYVYDDEDGLEYRGEKGNLRDRRSDRFPELNTYEFKEYYPNAIVPFPALGFNVDDGFFVGASFSYTKPGFKPDPYATRHTARAIVSTNGFAKFDYTGEFNHTFGRYNDFKLNAYFYGPNYVANYFGLGNGSPGTPEEEDIPGDDVREYNRARRTELFVNPQIRFRGKRNRLALNLGPVYHTVDIEDDPDEPTLIQETSRAGTSEFITDRVFDGQSFGGANLEVNFNNLVLPIIPDQGVKFRLYARHLINLDDSDRQTTRFGGNFNFYRTYFNRIVSFATRVGFEHNTGDPEFYQLATLGGRFNYRAARSERYAGQTSFYQNIDLRLRGFGFGRGTVPTVGGLILGLDHGRVWLDGEDDDTWHVAYGGGVWLAPFAAAVFNLTYFTDSEDQRVQFGFGFPF